MPDGHSFRAKSSQGPSVQSLATASLVPRPLSYPDPPRVEGGSGYKTRQLLACASCHDRKKWFLCTAVLPSKMLVVCHVHRASLSSQHLFCREEDIDALAHEIEVGGGMDSGQQQPESQSKATKVDTKDNGLEDKPEASEGGAGGKEEEEEGEEGHTVLTPAQKKAAKREREKKKKEAAKKAKQQQSSQKEEEKSKITETVNAAQTGQDEGSSVEVKGQSPPEAAQKPVEEGSGGEGAVGEEGEEGGDGDDKKKKKKKKKKTEEEKKGKVKKPGKSAILGIKKQIEALRLEQKRREEEELALQRAEEEAERKRQEEVSAS